MQTHLRRQRPADINAPLAAHDAHDAEVVIDNGAIARELSGPLVDEPHAIDPGLLRLRYCRPSRSDPPHMLDEFRNVTGRRGPARLGRLWS